VQKGLLWRNVVRFDPLKLYGNPTHTAYSYEDVLLRPALDALKATLTPDVSVEFSLAGEQGLSVFGYPSNWMKLMDKMRAELAEVGSKEHTFGVSFNWGEGPVGGLLCGRVQGPAAERACQPRQSGVASPPCHRHLQHPARCIAPTYLSRKPADKVCGCVEPKEKDPLLYNRTYVDRLKRWYADKGVDKLFGPSVIDVDGARQLMYKSGGAREGF
jgi:hypothetical protein